MAPAPVAPTLPVPVKVNPVEAATVPAPETSPAVVAATVGLETFPPSARVVLLRVIELPVPVAASPAAPIDRASLVLFAVFLEVRETTALLPAAEPLTVNPPVRVLVTVTSAPPVLPKTRIGVAVVSV